MKRIAVALFGLLAACGSGDDASVAVPGDASSDLPSAPPIIDGGATVDAASLDAALPAPDASDGGDGAPDPCADAASPPATLACTGLYSDFASQTLSPNAKPYAPATPLWSDGATKLRWIELPPGQTIDVSNPNEWTFPVGTKLFKQFTYEGVRVETRMFQKTAANYWVRATYAWNASQTEALISYGATVPVDADGGTWVIPTNDDCDSCHRGRSDRILGFEQVSLGLEGATGLTLLQLVVQGLVTPAPTQVNLRIGDDGTGLDGPALAWLHINCGVTCHNANENAEGYGAGMRLRLDPTWLDGSPATSAWDPLRTTINVPGVSGSIAGIPRILPGNPSGSAIVQLTTERGTLQMPPIASRFVDTTDVASVEAWIQHMPGSGDAGVQEAGASDATAGGGPDSGSLGADSGNETGAGPDSGEPDGTLVGDAGGPDGTLADGQADASGNEGTSDDASLEDAGLGDEDDGAASSEASGPDDGGSE
jgi:hypothetical protein